MTESFRQNGSTGALSGINTAALYACFFLSGVAGLIFEVLWAKYLALYVGSTGMAQVIVLATFMGGLALGSEILGHLADRVKNPLKMYAFLEFGIGVYALLFDRIFLVGRAAFFQTVHIVGLSAGGLAAGKIAACVLSILLPTFLMGGTLPAMGRFMVRSLSGVGPFISRLYFLNSLGAVFGCLLAGFYLIRYFGLQFSMIAGASLNICAGLVALTVFTRIQEQAAAPAPEETPPENASPLPGWALPALLLCISLSGAVSMVYEVAWIRLLTLVLGSSTYSFSLMLATFILGLALGSLLLSLRRKTSGYIAIFGVSELAVGLAILLSLPFYIKLPFWFNQLASSLVREPATFGLYQFCTFALCALVMIVPTILQGITLPAAIKAVTPDVCRLGRRIGFVYAINTVGTLAGSVIAGFVALPILGIKVTLELAVLLNVLIGLLVLATEYDNVRHQRLILGAVLASLLVGGVYKFTMGPWDQHVLSAGLYRNRQRIPDYDSYRQKVGAQRDLIFYRDGIDATIAVADLRGPEADRMLIINGKVDATSSKDMATQKLMAHLPMLLHPNPERVLIVGVGSGSTIGSVIAFDSVKEVDVVELSKDVIEASRLFAPVNGEYWNDPRVKVYWEDAKTFLQITGKKYDVIISEPTNPWIAGIAGVFSKEYFQTCREHLAENGFFLQWIQSYELKDQTFFMILETFTGTFPCYSLWNSTQTDTVLLGSPQPYTPDISRMQSRVKQVSVRRDLQTMSIDNLLTLLSLQMADHASAPYDIHWLGATHSDFFPALEYIAPRDFYIGSPAASVKWLDDRNKAPSNSNLWIHRYLQDYPVSSADLKNTYLFARQNPGLYDKGPYVWAGEWARRFPDNPEAVLARNQLVPPSYTPLIQDLPLEKPAKGEWAFPTGKLRCRAGYTNYIAQRSHLNSATAQQVLDDTRWMIGNYPEANDPDIYFWCGTIQYDLGDYPAAISNLYKAAQLYFPIPGRDNEVIESGLLLCESLIAQGKPGDALAAHEGVLNKYADDLRVWLLKSRIRFLLAAGAQAP